MEAAIKTAWTANARRPRRYQDPPMDMTPMVDLTFLLLIFFMVTTTFQMQKSMEVPRQNRDAAATRSIQDFEADDDFVMVRVPREEGIFWVDDREAIGIQDMLVKLREARRPPRPAIAPPSRLLVLAAPEASHEKVVMALDAGTEVGMDDVRLAPLEDEEP